VLIVLGGPIGAYDEQDYPFLLDELRLLERRLAADLPTLGICLGGQLMANTREYGLTRKMPGPVAVASFPNGASPYGVHDMAGNVWEWTSTDVPVDGAVLRALKGGSYLYPKAAARCANVLVDEPAFGHPDTGFRCVRDE